MMYDRGVKGEGVMVGFIIFIYHIMTGNKKVSLKKASVPSV